MTSLIVCLSTGKGTWINVRNIIEKEEWDNIVVITNEFGKEKFVPPKNAEMVVINTSQTTQELKSKIKSSLNGRIKGIEVALNITSGTGKEHMAIISAILDLGFAIRFVDVVDDSVVLI